MRYIDSGTRDPSQAVGQWLQNEFERGVEAVRIQSGFYSRDALRPFVPTFEGLAKGGGHAKIVIGSNEGQTVAEHVHELVRALRLPREEAALGLIYLSGAYFHPKTYHLVRRDGSQTAYVGSANFTLPGIAAKHVEAGILVDTTEGDSPALLSNIAAATDAWFTEERPGFERIVAPEDVERLLAQGIVSAAPPPRPPRPTAMGGLPPVRPSLAYLLNLAAANANAPIPELEATLAAAALPVVQRTPPYPPYVYFAPDATRPTRGAEALSGTTLGDATGLILRLSRDNDRHWRDAPGTANVSIPIAAASTLRFGVYGNRLRPRAEFDLFLRYVGDGMEILAQPELTGIMSYGFTPGDTGHSDLRFVIPRPPTTTIRRALLGRGLRLPQAGDLAILEWPSPLDPTFRMTITNPASKLGTRLANVWNVASVRNELPSRGACWLPAGLSPRW